MVLRKGEQVGSFRARMNAVFTMYRPGGSGASFSLAARGSVWRGSDHSMTNVLSSSRPRVGGAVSSGKLQTRKQGREVNGSSQPGRCAPITL